MLQDIGSTTGRHGIAARRGITSAPWSGVTSRTGTMSFSRHVSLALASAGLVTAASCGRLMHHGEDLPTTQVIFVNQSLDQADVFAVLDAGQSVRLGTVFAGRTDTLSVPYDIVSRGATVTIAARLLARNYAPHTGPLVLTPGQVLQVTLPSSLSTLTVLPGS
jgi:hypothetical protein